VWKEWDVGHSDWPAPPKQGPPTISSDGERQAVWEAATVPAGFGPPPPDPRTKAREAAAAAISIRDRDGKEVCVFRGHSEWPGLIHVRFSPSGRLVLSLTPAEVRVWEADTGKVLYRHGSADRRQHYVVQKWGEVSPDGRLLILPGDGGVKVVN